MRHKKGLRAYSFGTSVTAMASLGFRDGKGIIREVRWNLEMTGVEERMNGNMACIAVDWMEE